MEFQFYSEFFSSFSLPTLLIALIVSIVCALTDKLLKDKISYAVKNQIPFILSVVLYFIYHLIFISRAISFDNQIFLSGIVCGTVSTVMTNLFARIKRGDVNTSASATVLLIEGLINGLVPECIKTDVAIKLEQALVGLDLLSQGQTQKETQHDNAKQVILSIIKANLSTDFDVNDEQLLALAELIIKSVYSITN